MSELPETITVQKTPPNMSPEMASMFENFNKKGSMSPSATTAAVSVPTNGLASRQNLLNSSLTNASSLKSSQQVSERVFLYSFIDYLNFSPGCKFNNQTIQVLSLFLASIYLFVD